MNVAMLCQNGISCQKQAGDAEKIVATWCHQVWLSTASLYRNTGSYNQWYGYNFTGVQAAAVLLILRRGTGTCSIVDTSHEHRHLQYCEHNLIEAQAPAVLAIPNKSTSTCNAVNTSLKHRHLQYVYTSQKHRQLQYFDNSLKHRQQQYC